MSKFTRISSFYRRVYFDFFVKKSLPFIIIVVTASISFLIAFGNVRIHDVSSLTQASADSGSLGFNNSFIDCDFFDGDWIPDDSYPLYNTAECPFAEKGFNCLGNGLDDQNYLKWRWKPRKCYIPRFNVVDVLEGLRGKRIVFVGDSMSRAQWESMICMLMDGVGDKRSVYEVNGRGVTKQVRYLCVVFSSFNFTIEFFRSVFLVEHGLAPKGVPKRVHSTVKLDRLDNINSQWVNADILVFNTGHWWVPAKLFRVGSYFQIGRSIKLGMSIATAYKRALQTWAEWVETMVDRNRTHIFIRTFELSHWSASNTKICDMVKGLSSEAPGIVQNEYTEIVMRVVKDMKEPVDVLNVTPMSSLRGDAHVGFWSGNSSLTDCSHWCLPGLPDIWNEIVIARMFAKDACPPGARRTRCIKMRVK